MYFRANYTLAVRMLFVSVLLSSIIPIEASGTGFRFFEFTPWFVNNKGPSEAKGVIHFILGWSNRPSLDNFQQVPHFIKSLSDDGWDIVAAKVSEKLPNQEAQRLTRYHDAAPLDIQRRIGELKASGYRRVVLAGHSWGGWNSLLALQDRNLAVDAFIMSAPAVGPRFFLNGMPNPIFQKHFTEFPSLLKGLNVPTVYLDYLQDEADPGGRGAVVEKTLEAKQLPHIVISHPAGFKDHFAGWLPLFDYIYGGCIRAFLDNPKSITCERPGLVNDDFRSIINFKQVTDAEAKRISSVDSLVGKKFAAYTLDDIFREWHFVSASLRNGMTARMKFQENVFFRNGLLCASSGCRHLVKWSEREILEFNPANGNLTAWWIER